MKKLIVVCDDDGWTREFVSNFLIEEGHIVHAFENGERALQHIKSNEVDLVVSDINMPKMTGIELIQEINALDLKLPIIFLTGVIDPTEILNAFSYNYFEYITKPINPFELKESTDKALTCGYQKQMFSSKFINRLKKA